MLTTILVLSLVINVFFVWYVVKLLKKLLYVSDNIGGLVEDLSTYAEHVENVYSMETYYGDPTIELLLKYSKDLVQEIKTYEEIYELMAGQETEEELEAEEDLETEERD